MSTAHRPTFHPARGSQTGGHVLIPTAVKRARDLPSETGLLNRDSIPDAATSRDEFKRKLDKVDMVVEIEKIAIQQDAFDEDADEVLVNDSLDDENSSDGGDDSDDEELIRELARIKQERAEEELKRQRRENERDQVVKEQEIAASNPLVGAGVLRRRWDDDTVFQAQSRSMPKEKRGFVNDIVKSNFHRKFLNKYIG